MEYSLIISALGLGVASGFHCVGMCGPIALSMGFSRKQAASYYLQNLTYQLGRIFTYALLGAVLGLVGEGFKFAGFQQYLTIFAGILLIIFAVSSTGGNNVATKMPFLSRFLMNLKIRLGKILQKADYRSRFATGVLNGLLPCGMVYMALTAALAAGGIWQSSAFMALFGLGTLPFMFAVVLAGNLITQKFRSLVLKFVPVLMVMLGSLFVLRGLELGIPYVSPKAEVMTIHQKEPGCCHTAKAATCH